MELPVRSNESGQCADWAVISEMLVVYSEEWEVGKVNSEKMGVYRSDQWLLSIKQ